MKVLRRIVLLGLALLIVLGVVWTLAFFGVIPVKAMVARAPFLAGPMTGLGLYRAPRTAAPELDPAALAAERQKLDAEREELARMREGLELRERTLSDADAARPSGAPSVPAEPAADEEAQARLARVYEAMPAEEAAKVFARLPDNEVLPLLRRMDEKQVGRILVALKPERASELTRQMLARP